MKNKVITFGLDRIFDPIVLEKSYNIDHSFSPDLYFKHSLGITVYEQLPNEIIIETNPILSKYLTSQPIHHSQKLIRIEESGNHFFTLHLLITYELKMLLLGFGKDCKIIAPNELREDILNELKQSVINYSN